MLEDILNFIRLILVPVTISENMDRWIWCASSDLNYSAKSGYNWLRNNEALATQFGGGLLRGVNGYWICGFSCLEGHGSVILAELSAVCRGLMLAWDRGETNIICETDSLEVFHLIRSESSPVVAYIVAVLMEIRNLLNRNWDVRFSTFFARPTAQMVAGLIKTLFFWDLP
ncbi:Ribonuclease H-like superfamily [Sesbania bispinosa]|nr:Ribonuclease H-like superfamily [Sesbania bispinosa]